MSNRCVNDIVVYYYIGRPYLDGRLFIAMVMMRYVPSLYCYGTQVTCFNLIISLSLFWAEMLVCEYLPLCCSCTFRI